MGKMPVYMDKVTEAIAHFIGLFHISETQGRLRLDYNEFVAARALAADQSDLQGHQVQLDPQYALNDFDPKLHYVPEPAYVDKVGVGSHVDIHLPFIPVPSDVPAQNFYYQQQMVIAGSARIPGPIPLDPPGSIAVVIGQDNHLSDNDTVGVGGHGFNVAAISPATQAFALEALLHDALHFTPEAALPGTPPDMAVFIESYADSVAATTLDQPSDAVGSIEIDQHHQAVHIDGQAQPEAAADPLAPLQGLYINGASASETPKLLDHVPAQSPLLDLMTGDTPEPEPAGDSINGPAHSAYGTVAHGAGGLALQPSVTVDAGENVLVNSAALTNKGLSGTVFAVSGKYVEVNSISQVNAWSDSDSIGQSLHDWASALQQTTAFNIADFQRLDVSGDDSGSGSGFPAVWGVTEIKGDLIFMNWVQQFNFMLDNDVHTLSSSGVQTSVTTGQNQAMNGISFDAFGHFYDLILVGGSLYDANIISQTNVLLDDDFVGGFSGFHTNGKADISTSGNLLWNQAAIVNAGGGNLPQYLTDAYRNALDRFGSGEHKLSDQIFTDSAFSGLAGLRVLYVSGSIYDLQYISQTNVLGDSDQVALAMNHATPAGAHADWKITTGSNALVNQALISDLDSVGKTYVGHGLYSDELLVQTDIIKTDHLLDGKPPVALVNEAVAFLGDDFMSNDSHHDGSGGSVLDPHSGLHPAHTDVMQAVVT